MKNLLSVLFGGLLGLFFSFFFLDADISIGIAVYAVFTFGAISGYFTNA